MVYLFSGRRTEWGRGWISVWGGSEIPLYVLWFCSVSLGKNRAGIRNGEKIRLIGQGKKGINGGKNGDLFIKINIQNNNKFRLQGYDIVTDLYLTPWEAALGKRVNIDSIEDPISIYVPPGIQSGEKVKIPQKGYKDGRGSRGDLIAEIKTVVPKKLTEEEKELFEQLKSISKFNPRTAK